MKSKKLLRNLGIVVVVLVALGVGVRAAMSQFKPAEKQLPTARVKRGTLEIKVYSRGELRPTNSMSLMAPPVVGGGALQIVTLLKTGTRVKPGDVVIEFDPSEQEYKLEQAQSQVAEAEQQIAKSKADAAVSASQDKVSLLKARFDVRRAELDVSRNELLSTIDAQKNVLAFDEAKRRLAQLEQDVKSRVASNAAALAVLEEKRNKSRLDMQQAQQAIDSMRVKATIGGVVAIKDNMDAMGGFFFTGMVLPEYREGDVVRSGRTVAEVLETADMEIKAKITENDRANVNPGQAVEVRIDAYPGLVLPGKVKSVAGLATGNWWSSDGTRRFDASFKIEKLDQRLRSGQTAQITIAGQEIKNALFLPRQVLFDKEGKPVLYVKNGAKFDEREVKITHRTESQITVEGLKEGDEVALVNPEKAAGGAKAGAAQPSLGGAR
jgi:multidrug resistance efflux pump